MAKSKIKKALNNKINDFLSNEELDKFILSLEEDKLYIKNLTLEQIKVLKNALKLKLETDYDRS